VGGESYKLLRENPFRSVSDDPVSTFSIDVDTASYANIRRMLNLGSLPPPGAVRIEEMVNYFKYDYASPGGKDEHPLAVYGDVARCPWNSEHRLLRVGIKGRELPPAQRPPCNLVFLLDVSGSMEPANKLPLFKRAMKMLVKRLDEGDTVGVVVYAANSSVALETTDCGQKDRILGVIDGLQADGSTNGGAGIKQAYKMAAEAFIKGGVNRVILCTDGDFNVGITDHDELVDLIRDRAKSGVFLSVLGFGTGNLKDDRLEELADKGNGNYAYIDTMTEARKVLIAEAGATLITIAKDVKIQIEFNPTRVSAYRLIGYENRILRREDFNDDRKDAGEVGAGYTVTALYEIVPAGTPLTRPVVDPLKYQKTYKLTPAATSKEMLTLKLRYKKPDGDKSTLITRVVPDNPEQIDESQSDFRFAAAVASFGMILRGSQHSGTGSLDAVIETAQSARGEDPNGRRTEFVQLAKTARELMANREPRNSP
jgi:Ca-activated chloride channel family protein